MTILAEVMVSPRDGMPEETYPAISAPPLQLQQSPSLVHSIFLSSAPKTIKAITSMQGYMEGAVHLTKLELDPQDDWLPTTESRKGNIYYSAFHTLSSGIGAQALVLPLAFVTLGWTWGIVCLSLMFAWQLYTLWLLIQLHESQTGVRYSRYLTLSMAAFGEYHKTCTD
ncbi:hypothetical protein SAY86_016656 [Trapa natans]|uniref:Amino acid transporter transmembrane domain-containing protein n=1 Tax=Trapa natans TaxID=22666 RepID=A0AAN7QWI2_TRANT|nr:hypothetical protein SAY86_016656 [Trapa natans]